MVFLRGTRTVRIKTYTDHEHRCDACKNFDMTVMVYRSYFHFFFIPVAPNGEKTVKAYCNNCKMPFRNDPMNQVYEYKTKTPYYLYSFTIFIALLIIAGFAISIVRLW